MAEKTAVENGRISSSEGRVTLTLDRVILHTIVHHSSTSIYMPNFIKIKKRFMEGRKYVRAYRHLRPALLDLRVDVIIQYRAVITYTMMFHQ